jgi:hypothetical protein
LKEHEKNYATHNVRLGAIVHALKMWRHYLIRNIFELRIHHNALKYLFQQPELNSKKVRWLEFLFEFDFKIKNIKGKEKKVVGALSKKIHVATFNIYKSDLKKRVIDSLTKNKYHIQVKYG